jgi:hypothetical protein
MRRAVVFIDPATSQNCHKVQEIQYTSSNPLEDKEMVKPARRGARSAPVGRERRELQDGGTDKVVGRGGA